MTQKGTVAAERVLRMASSRAAGSATASASAAASRRASVLMPSPNGTGTFPTVSRQPSGPPDQSSNDAYSGHVTPSEAGAALGADATAAAAAAGAQGPGSAAEASRKIASAPVEGRGSKLWALPDPAGFLERAQKVQAERIALKVRGGWGRRVPCRGLGRVRHGWLATPTLTCAAVPCMLECVRPATSCRCLLVAPASSFPLLPLQPQQLGPTAHTPKLSCLGKKARANTSHHVLTFVLGIKTLHRRSWRPRLCTLMWRRLASRTQPQGRTSSCSSRQTSHRWEALGEKRGRGLGAWAPALPATHLAATAPCPNKSLQRHRNGQGAHASLLHPSSLRLQRVDAEMKLRKLLDAEHRLPEEVFPR